VSNTLRIVNLKPEEIEAIRRLEESLGNRFCLLAVEKVEQLYVLELKLHQMSGNALTKFTPRSRDSRLITVLKKTPSLPNRVLKPFLQEN